MATRFVRESKQSLLDTSHLVDILDLLKKHRYSGFSYYDLGLRLGLLPRTLDVIEAENIGNVRKGLRQCLTAWLEQRDNVESKGGPTYDTLIQALRDEEENAVADGIERDIGLKVDPYVSRTVKSTLRDHYSSLSHATEFCLKSVSGEFFSKGLISRDVKRSPTFDKIENEFVALLPLYKEDMTKLEEKCRAFVHCLAKASGPAKDAAVALAEDWEREVMNKHGLEWSLSIEGARHETMSIADEIDKERKIEKWLEEGEVELKVTRINMHGAPGAGKTCSLKLLLNEPPPEELTDSTSVACPAVQATRISIDDKNKWERVKKEDLLNKLASHLKEAPNKTKRKNFKFAHILCLIIVFCYTFVKNSRISTFFLKFVSKLVQRPNERPKNKPSETKPAETEVIKEISNAHATKKFSTDWVYFIDSGGQPAYRELLPLFTRAAALNIITIDLTKGLDEKCQFQYRIDQHTSPIDTNLMYSNRGIIQSTISSEAMLNHIKIPFVSRMPKHPHYLILGTRSELVSKEEKLKEMNESLTKYKANDQVIKQNERKGLIIFPVNTLLPAWSKEREEASVDLCTAVSNCRVEMTIELPIRLFTFEIALQMEAENKNQSFLTREEVIEIGRSLRLDTESDIDVALQYLHNVTIILYFRDILPNIIFVDPKPILDVLSRLIAITYVDHDKLDLLTESPPSTDETSNLIKFGLFKEDVFKKIGMKLKIFDKNFQPSHMITLLKHLHIIAKVENREEGDYFFPCALPSYDKLNPAPTEIQPLLIGWEINNSGTKTLAIPQGLFPLTIVHLLEKKDEVDFTPVGKGFYRYHDAMSLRAYIKSEEYTIDIINRYTHIEIRFNDCKEFCPQIRELVTEAIEKGCKALNVKNDHIFAFECPNPSEEQEQCYCIVKEEKSSTRCTRCRPHCNVLQGDDDSYKCWFSDCLLSSPDTVEVSTPPAPPSDPAKQDSTIACSNLRKWGCYLFMIFLAVLAGVTINHFVVEKNTNDVEKITSITMTHIATGALPAQHHHGSTTVNPYIDGAGQLSIEDLDIVLTVLDKALFGPTNWNDLGLKLGLIMTQLDVIGESGDSRKSLKGTIKAWLEGADNAKSRTWQTLIDAVRETGNRAAAERIREKIKS